MHGELVEDGGQDRLLLGLGSFGSPGSDLGLKLAGSSSRERR
jgi:hypothetical protein